jgi:hypothetical protein
MTRIFSAILIGSTLPVLAMASIGVVGCKTTDKPASAPAQIANTGDPMAVAMPVRDYDIATMKTNFKNVMSDELKGKQLWALFLKEPETDALCRGMATEVYYFADKGDNNQDGYPVVTAKPMPMNGPCGFLIGSELKRFSEIGGNLMESTPMGEIGTFDKIRVSVKQAIINSQARYKTFKYSQGVKIYRHLHPDMWSFPWYAIYGEACGQSATVIMNANNGVIVPNMEAPPAECP